MAAVVALAGKGGRGNAWREKEDGERGRKRERGTMNWSRRAGRGGQAGARRSAEREEGGVGRGWTAVKAVKYQSRDGSCHRRANIMGGVLN